MALDFIGEHMRLLLVLFSIYSASVSAESVGTIVKDGHEVNIVDTYVIFNEKDHEITIHLLPCKYTKELSVGWQPDFGFLKCYPIENKKYFTSPGASISIKLDDTGKASRTIFSTTLIGNNNAHDYQGFSKSWFKNPPIDDLLIKEKDMIKFLMHFIITKKSINVSLNINVKFDEIIKSNNTLNSTPKSSAN